MRPPKIRMGVCDYCPWPAIAWITLNQGRLRDALGLPVRHRKVCPNHLRRGIGNTAPGWYRH